MMDLAERTITALTSEGRNMNFWLLTLTVAIWIWVQPGAEGRYVSRAVEAVTSVGMTFAATPALAEWSGWPFLVVALIVTAFGQDVLRSARSMARDPAFIRDLFNTFFNRGGK